MEASDRFPQWSMEETKELVMMRKELDQKFMETKRNKLLWEAISTEMKHKGFNRSAEQCKCKWKNLVTRYKGCETMEPDVVKQHFPFYDDLQALFTAKMERMLRVEAGGGGGASASKLSVAGDHLSSEEDDDMKEGREELLGFEPEDRTKAKMKKGKNIVKISNIGRSSKGDSNGGTLRDIVEEFMKQQMEMEREWREEWERREKERAAREMEWRVKMVEIEKERMEMERMWREREEQRLAREEARAEKRDALMDALLTKLTRQS